MIRQVLLRLSARMRREVELTPATRARLAPWRAIRGRASLRNVALSAAIVVKLIVAIQPLLPLLESVDCCNKLSIVAVKLIVAVL